MVLLRSGRAQPRHREEDRLATFGQWFERSVVGQALISGLVSVVVLIGVVWNLPDSHLKRAMTKTLHPIAASTGLQQTWSMYAPEPVSSIETVIVRVTMDDGTNRKWSWRRGDPVIGPFTWYHWQKLKETVVREPRSAAGVAHWVVRELTTPAERPVRVMMLLRNDPLPAPGQDTAGPTTLETLYSENLGGRP